MGDAQSAPREARGDAAAEEEEGGEVKDVETGQDIDSKVLKNNRQILDINKKAESSIVEVNGHCEEEIALEAANCPEIHVSEPLKEEDTPFEIDEIHLKEVTEETKDKQLGHDDVIEMDAKQNDINESFRKFFSNIGLKLTVKRGSADQGTVPSDVSEEESSKPEDVTVEDTAKGIIEDVQHIPDLNTAEEVLENDSTVCQTGMDGTPEGFQENEEKKTEETKEEISHDAGTSLPPSEDTTTQEEPRPTSPASLDETASPFKKFFTTGLFSSLRKKKKLEDDEAGEKEQVQGEEKVTKTEHDQQHDEDVTPGVDGPTTKKELNEEKTKEEDLTAKSSTAQDEAQPPSIVVNEVTNSQEIVQESPLKRLLSGSSFKKLSKKQKARKSSDAKLSDSGEHMSDQLLSSAESVEKKKGETPAQTSTEVVSGEDGAWFSFKKLVTPQKKKKSSVDHEEGSIPGSRNGAKPGEGEQISDHSTEEAKRRKDSSVSWEAVLCGSGRRRSRKTSDSEEEVPQADDEDKQKIGSKEAPSTTSNEIQEVLASSNKQKGSPPEGDEGSTWRSFKKLVTPKRKMKDEEESNSEVGQDDSAFSIKRLLSGRKTRKSVDVSADEVNKDVASISDEDSETPAVVPLSEFDLTETQTEAEIESFITKEADNKPQTDISEVKEESQSEDTVPNEANDIPDNKEALEKEISTAAPTNEEQDELTESSEHQQLSDIPEEGVLTETTPASVVEEPAKDETIAEDLLEITSEAITAPEPADVTLADETEMVSAVSQLSESTKTSGNTTPVPAEYSVMNTESLLQQVSETISRSPKAVPVTLEEPSAETEVSSVSHQILQSSVLDQPKILEIYKESDAAYLKEGLNAEEIGAANKVTATAQAESISHLKEVVSTEITSEVPKEKLDTAEPAVKEEVCEVNVSELPKDIKDLKITAERQHLAEDAGGVEEVVSTESLSKGEEVFKTVQAKNDRRKTLSEEELAVTSADDKEEAGGKVADQIVTEEDTETKEKAYEQAQPEAGPPTALDELEELARTETVLANAEDDILSKEERPPENFQLTEIPSQDLTKVTKESQNVDAKTDQRPISKLAENVVQTYTTELSISENISTAEIDIDEPKLVESLPEVTEEAKKKEPQNDQTEVTSLPGSVKVPTLESEEDIVQSLKKEVSLSDDAAAETEAEISQQVESLIEITEEAERKEPHTSAAEINGFEVTEVLESIPAQLESEKNAVQYVHEEEKHMEASFTLVRGEQEDKEPEKGEVQTYQSEVTEGVERIEASTLESQKNVVLSLNEEQSLSDISTAETEESKPVQPLTDQQEVKETKTDLAQTDYVELSNDLKSVQTPAVKSEEDVVQLLNEDAEPDIQEHEEQIPDESKDKDKQGVVCAQGPIFNSGDMVQFLDKAVLFSENLSPTLTNMGEPGLVKLPCEEHKEQENNEPSLESSEATQVYDVTEAINIVHEGILELEGSRVEVLEKDIALHDAAPKQETVEEMPKEKPGSLTQGIIQAEERAETEYSQESEAAIAPYVDPKTISSEVCEMEALSYDTPAMEKVTDELIITESEEPLSLEVESSPLNAQDTISDVEMCQPTTAPSNEDSETQELEQRAILQDIPQQEDTDIVTEELESKAVSQLDQETDAKPCVSKAEHEENVFEDVKGLQALTAVHISLINKDPINAEVLEKTTCLAKSQPDCVDMAKVSEESKNEVNLCEQEERVEVEKAGLHSDAMIKVAVTDHNFIPHEVMSNLKSVSTEKPNVVVREALISKIASETEFIDTVETAKPLVLDDINQVAEPSIAVLKMRVPTVEIEVNHKVQVHVMSVDVRSAVNAVDTLIQVGVTEDKEVIDVCHEGIQKVENLSATAGIEEETTSEGIEVTVQDVKQHVTSNSPETSSKLAAENVEQVIKQSETVCETDQKQSIETEDEKGTNVITETSKERQDQEAVVTTDHFGISAEEEGLKESKIPANIPESSDVSIKDYKEDFEEPKAEEPEVCSIARNRRTDELEGKGPDESTMEPMPSPQRQITTPGNTGLAVPQSTGLISSVGNLESPSSLSLEFKLNIQFAQAKTPTWPSTAPTERTEAVKQVDVSEAGVQAEEPIESVRQEDECKKQTELNEVAAQASSITEPDAGSHLLQRAVIATQPLLQDVGVQAVETTEPVEQIQSTERAIPKAEAIEVLQSVRQNKRAVLLSKPLLSEVATKSWAFRQSEDENDQDVWLDAEEDIYPQQETQTSRDEVDEHVKLGSENEHKDEPEFEIACSLETEDTGTQRDVLEKETCEIESEGEDFTVALEDLGHSISAVE